METVQDRAGHRVEVEGGRTWRTSSSSIEPGISLLFLSTNSEAPISRWRRVSNGEDVVRDRATLYLLEEQAAQLLPAVVQALPVRGINDPDERVGLLEIILPICPQRLLAADIPLPSVSEESNVRTGNTDRCSACSFRVI